MAKQTLRQRIKGFFSGKSGGGSSKATTRRASAIRQKNTGGGSARVAIYRSLRRRDDEEEERPRYKSMADATKTTSKASGFAAAIDAKSNSKPDPKEAARKTSQEKARKRLDDIKKERKEFHEATEHRYDVNEKGISKEEKAKRRIAQKNQAYDVNAEKFEVEKHPVAESFGRGALSGVSFGASELALRNSKARQESGAEEFYQKHKNKYAEGAGEIVGSLASFGATAGATEKLATKVGGKAIEKGAERLASRKVIQSAAKRSVNKAVKKGLVKEGSEELIKQVGKEKAKKVASALGTDIVQNLTTGALYDVNKASAEHKVGSSDWWKELGTSAALNAAITGGVAGVSAARGGKRMAVEAADELASIRRNPKVSLNRRRKTDVILPNERPSTAVKRRGYHAGDLGKAEWHGNQAGSRRGTGHFGTGTYFAGTEDILEREGYGNRPRHEIDLGRYNTYRPKDREQGMRVHENLKRLNRESGDIDSLVKRASLTDADIPALRKALDEASSKEDLEKIADRLFSKQDMEAISEQAEERLKHWRENNVNPDYDFDIDSEIDEMLEDADLSDFFIKGDTDIDELLNAAAERSAAKRAGEAKVPPATYERAYETELSDAIGKLLDETEEYGNDTVKALRELGEDLGADESQINKALARTQEVLNGYDPNGIFLKEDSASTVFMKALGYEGVDVTGIEGLDNTEFGSVIYDLRPEDARLIREGKPRVKAEAKATPPEVRAEIKATPPRAEGEFATVDEAMPSTDPALTAENETRAALERRVDEIAEDIPFTDENGNPVTGERLKVNKVAEDAAASESLPSGVKQVRSAYEYNNGEQPKLEDGILTSWNEAWKASKEYSASHATGNKKRMSKVAVSELNAMDSEAERELRQRLADSGELDYEAIDSHELYDKIAKQMRDDPDRWIKDMIEINEGGALDFRSTPEWQARVQYIMGTVDPSADQASEIAYTEAFKLAQNISSKGGQTLNLRRNFVHLTPMGKRDAILDDFINILDKSKGFRKNHPQLDSLGHFDQRNYIRNILMEDDAIRDGVEKLVKANDIDDVSEAFTELMLNVNKKNPKSKFDVVQELRYLNMLGNPKTHIRNIFGSAFFSPMRQISNAIRAGIEDNVVEYAKRSSGNAFEITKHGGLSPMAAKEAWAKNPTTEAGQAALEAFNRNKAEILGSAKYETNSYKGRGKTLVGKGVDALSDFNSNLLSKEDDFFRSRAYRENYIKSYNRYLKDGKPITDKIKRRIEQEALEESQIATFNEYNNFAKWLSSITSKANDANASTLARWGGRGVNAVMPFTKVPANIMKQSMNYSPIGIAKGFANIKTAAKKGDSKLLNKAIDELSSGLTGTGIFGLGMLLGKTTDMFTTNAGKNDPAAKFKKDRGMQNYSITFKDPETGKGYSFTLDWLVPASATFFSGVELSNQMKSGDFNLLDIGGDWSTVMTRLAEPVMETSMLSGLHGMLETMRSGSNDDDTKSAIGILMRETAQSWLNSLVPTVAGQIARTAYKSDMQVVGDTDWEYFRNQVKSKAGLANTKILGEPLGADTDAYGNVKGDKGNTLIGAIKEGDSKALKEYGKSGLKNFLSPANIQKVDFSEVDNAKLAEYERRVKDGEDPQNLAYLFPKKQYKKQFKLAGEEVKMSNRDLSTYNQAKTTGGEEGMRYILENIMFNRQTLDEKGKKIPADSAYTKAEKQALMNKFKGKSMREVEEWLYAQPEFKNATDAERKRAIEGLWNLTKDTKAVASQRVGEQAVIKAQGGDVNEYNFKNEITEKKRDALQPYVEAGILTYEEAVDFARNAGKTYYTENEDGGSSATYYNKKEMIEYLVKKGYSYEKAEALFNSFKNANAKPYSGNSLSSGRSGYRRGGGYRRSGRRSSTPTINAKSMASATKSVKGTSVKLTPPTPKTKVAAPKFKKYEV